MSKILTIPARSYRAFLYDCDGTLADTMKPHIQSWMEVFAKNGVQIQESLLHELAGMPGTKTVIEVNRRSGSDLDPIATTDEKEKLFLEQYLHLTQAIEPVVAHLKSQAGLAKIAVVSGGRRRVVQEILKIIGVDALVEVLVCAEDVIHGKPHPEPFLMAAERLGVPPEDCLVFEDAEFGFRSAQAAKMDFVRV